MNPINTYHSGEKLICGGDPQVNCEQENKKVDTNIPSKTNTVVYYDVASELGCAGGISYQRVAVYTETGVFSRFDYIDSSGVISATMPAGFTLGPCVITTPEITHDVEYVCNETTNLLDKIIHTWIDGVAQADVITSTTISCQDAPPTNTEFEYVCDIVTGFYQRIERSYDINGAFIPGSEIITPTTIGCSSFEDIYVPHVNGCIETRTPGATVCNQTVTYYTFSDTDMVGFTITANDGNGNYTMIQEQSNTLAHDDFLALLQTIDSGEVRAVEDVGPGLIAFHMWNGNVSNVIDISPTEVQFDLHFEAGVTDTPIALTSPCGPDPVADAVYQADATQLRNIYDAAPIGVQQPNGGTALFFTVTSYSVVPGSEILTHTPAKQIITKLVDGTLEDSYYEQGTMTPIVFNPATDVFVNQCTATQMVNVPNCDGTTTNKTVDDVTGAYLLNQKNLHTAIVYDNITSTAVGDITTTLTGTTVGFTFNIAYTNWGGPGNVYTVDFGNGVTHTGSVPSFDYVNEPDGEYRIKIFSRYEDGGRYKSIHLGTTIVIVKTGNTLTMVTVNPMVVNRSIQRTLATAQRDYCGTVPQGGAYTQDGTAYTTVGALALSRLEVADEWLGMSDVDNTVSTTDFELVPVCDVGTATINDVGVTVTETSGIVTVAFVVPSSVTNDTLHSVHVDWADGTVNYIYSDTGAGQGVHDFTKYPDGTYEIQCWLRMFSGKEYSFKNDITVVGGVITAFEGTQTYAVLSYPVKLGKAYKKITNAGYTIVDSNGTLYTPLGTIQDECPTYISPYVKSTTLNAVPENVADLVECVVGSANLVTEGLDGNITAAASVAGGSPNAIVHTLLGNTLAINGAGTNGASSAGLNVNISGGTFSAAQFTFNINVIGDEDPLDSADMGITVWDNVAGISVTATTITSSLSYLTDAQGVGLNMPIYAYPSTGSHTIVWTGDLPAGDYTVVLLTQDLGVLDMIELSVDHNIVSGPTTTTKAQLVALDQCTIDALTPEPVVAPIEVPNGRIIINSASMAVIVGSSLVRSFSVKGLDNVKYNISFDNGATWLTDIDGGDSWGEGNSDNLDISQVFVSPSVNGDRVFIHWETI